MIIHDDNDEGTWTLFLKNTNHVSSLDSVGLSNDCANHITLW